MYVNDVGLFAPATVLPFNSDGKRWASFFLKGEKDQASEFLRVNVIIVLPTEVVAASTNLVKLCLLWWHFSIM